jgi:hypothetical protein
MSSFDSRLFMPVLPDGRHYNVFDAKFKDLRFKIPVSQTISIDAKLEGNLPLIAHLYLGDQNLWWVLLQFNAFNDPIKDVSAGSSLKIPDRRSLLSLLQSADDQETTVVL